VYAGCQAEKVIYIINSVDQTLKPMPLTHFVTCAELCLNDSILVLGALNGELFFYNLSNPELPTLKGSVKFNNDIDLTCLRALNQEMIICGQE
jgi:hypothetical protein